MRKVFIKYDPYEMKSTVVVDGKEIQKNKHCDSNLKNYLDSNVHMPIQSWIDPIERDGWKGLLETLCLMGDKDIIIEFSGRKIDYESIQASFTAQNEMRKLGAKLTFCELAEEIIPDSEMKANIDNVISMMLTERFEQIVNDSMSDALIKKYARLRETYDEINAEEFRIIFTGTYSSGKSSTINALIGKNLLPTASGTCTAKICRIIHSLEAKCLAVVRYEYRGTIKEFSCVTAEEVQDRIKAAEDSVEGIEVYTDLSALYPDGVQSDFKIVIVDTPGTDSATGNDTEKSDAEAKRLSKKSHIEITKEVLQSKQKEMVVLISDEKFEDENIVELLDIIEESAERDGGAFNDRFLFVMNMCDELSYSNQGENLGNYVKNFITNIKKIPNSARIRNIVNPRVFPITSGAALAVVNGYTTKPGILEGTTKKAELYGYYEGFCKKVYYYSPAELERNFDEYIDQIREQHGNYHNFCLEEHSAVSEATKYRYLTMLNGELSLPERVLVHSGVPALGNAIQEYIRSYAYPIKVRQLLGCFTDILDELVSHNMRELEALKEAKKYYSGAVSAREMTEEEKVQEEKRKETLESTKEKMVRVKRSVDDIKETVPEINNIRSSFYVIKNSIAARVAGRQEVLKDEGNQIIEEISRQIDILLGKISDTIRDVKVQKRKATDELYKEFISYVSELEAVGLMENGSFSLKDTVAYKKIIDKESFTQAEEADRYENNPNKHHIEFGYGIGNFFSSIGRAWKTRKEPETIKKTYVNIEKFISENINPIEAEIDIYVEKLRSDYQSDIQSLKSETNDRVDRVLELIKEIDADISKMKKKVASIASDEKAYAERIEKIEDIRAFIDSLISQIQYTQI